MIGNWLFGKKLESRNSRRLYRQLEKGGLELLGRLRDTYETESEILDFKLAANCGLPLEIEDKVNLSKAISGFANSGGGVLVWGVYCNENANKADCVQDLRPIEQLMGFRSAVIAASVQLVTPPVRKIDTHMIFDGEDRGFLIMHVPNSPNLVQSVTKKGKGFFERVGTSFLEMADDRLAEKAQASYGKAAADRRLAAGLRVLLPVATAVAAVIVTYSACYPALHPEQFHAIRRLGDGTLIIFPGDKLSSLGEDCALADPAVRSITVGPGRVPTREQYLNNSTNMPSDNRVASGDAIEYMSGVVPVRPSGTSLESEGDEDPWVRALRESMKRSQ